MPVDTKHPQWSKRREQWTKMTDSFDGEDAIKGKRTEYLPATQSMITDGYPNAGTPGTASYEGYIARAPYPTYVQDGISAMVGIMHQDPAKIELPEALEPMRDNATVDGLSLNMLLMRMNEWQLLYGRLVLLGEAPTGARVDQAVPYIAAYSAPSVINWDAGERIAGRQNPEFVVFDESGPMREGNLEYTSEKRYRVCAMSRAIQSFSNTEQQASQASGVYQVATFQDGNANLSSAQWITPSIAGRTLDRIPAVPVNATDISWDVGEIPMLNLANLCLVIYRTEADFRQNLHMQGQDTLVITGAEEDKDKPTRLGAGAKIHVPRDGKVDFVGLRADALDSQRQTIEKDHERAQAMTTKLFDSSGSSYASGSALRIRITAKTATLRTVAVAGAKALEELLKILAVWVGADPEKVKVTANLNFSDTSAASATLLELVQSKTLGAPISNRSIHRFMLRNDLTEFPFDEEVREIEDEKPLVQPPKAGIGGIAGGALGRAGSAAKGAGSSSASNA